MDFRKIIWLWTNMDRMATFFRYTSRLWNIVSIADRQPIFRATDPVRLNLSWDFIWNLISVLIKLHFVRDLYDNSLNGAALAVTASNQLPKMMMSFVQRNTQKSFHLKMVKFRLCFWIIVHRQTIISIRRYCKNGHVLPMFASVFIVRKISSVIWCRWHGKIQL